MKVLLEALLSLLDAAWCPTSRRLKQRSGPQKSNSISQPQARVPRKLSEPRCLFRPNNL